MPSAEVEPAAFLDAHGSPGRALHNLARGVVDDAPIDLDLVLTLLDAEAPTTNPERRRHGHATAAEALVLGSEARDSALESVVGAFPLALLHALRCGHLAALTQRALGAEVVEGQRFQHLEVGQAAHLGDDHLGQPFAHRGLPIGDAAGFSLGHANGGSRAERGVKRTEGEGQKEGNGPY